MSKMSKGAQGAPTQIIYPILIMVVVIVFVLLLLLYLNGGLSKVSLPQLHL
ncbi:MAG: hypothetical protein V1839_00400 [archaeon]